MGQKVAGTLFSDFAKYSSITHYKGMGSILKSPSAWIPVVLSLGIVGMFWMYTAGIMPPEPPGDEGTAAHLFQIWLILEVLLISFFAIKWLPRYPKDTGVILFLQLCGVFAG